MDVIRSDDGQIIALVVRSDFDKKGINFVTLESDPIQLGINSYEKGSHILEHYHKKRNINIQDVQEVLYIVEGEVDVTLYDEKNVKISLLTIKSGDTIFLASGGHGFHIKKDTKLIEVKQGPYGGRDIDKTLL